MGCLGGGLKLLTNESDGNRDGQKQGCLPIYGLEKWFISRMI